MVSCVLLALSAAPTWAAFDLTTDTELTIDGDSHWFNDNSGWGTKTYGAYQYMVYWDAPDATTRKVYAKITRRKLSDNTMLSIRFDGTGAGEERTTASELRNINDGHDYVAVGISPTDGRVHISWSSHHALHHYAISNAGCISQATFSQATCRFDWSRLQTPEVRDRETFRGRNVEVENVLTYPVYFNDNRGALYMAYRFGESSRGTHYINVYDDRGGWTSRGRILYGRQGSGAIETDVPDDGNPETPDPARSEIRGVYPQGFAFDKNERLHVLWVFKELLREVGLPDLVHGMYYGYSDDLARTWKYGPYGRERALATSGSEPITARNSEAEVFSIPAGSYPGGGELVLDSNNRPHFAFAMTDTGVLADRGLVNIRLRHLWLGTDGSWYASWIQPTEEADQQTPFGGLILDGADNAYFVYNRNLLGWIPFNYDVYGQAELTWDHVTWQGGDYLDVQQQTNVTCVETNENPRTAISPTGNNQVRISLNNNTDATHLELTYITSETPAEVGSDIVAKEISENDRTAYNTYTIDLSRAAHWNGTLLSLLICVEDPRADAGDQFRLDYVRVTDSGGTAAKAWEFREGGKMRLAEASAANNWNAAGSSWTTSELLPGISGRWSDSGFIIDPQRYKDSRKVDFLMTTQGAPRTESLDLHEFDIVEDTVRKDWRFDVSAMDWTAIELVSEPAWASEEGTGTLNGRITGNDSAVDSAENLSVNLGTASRVKVRMKQSAGTTAMLCWVVDDRPTSWSIRRCSRPFTVRADGRFNTYEIETREWRDWSRHELTKLRLEPSDSREVTSGTFNVDYIRIVD